MKPDVRAVLLHQAREIEADDVAVFLSAGIDSASIMFALLEVGKRPHAYSFMLDGRTSTDFVGARQNAERFGVPFTPVFLPIGLDVLKRDVLKLAALGAKKKTDFECGWPMLYAYEAVGERAVASGMGADGHFCISKKGMIHYRDRIDEFRRGLYSSPSYAQAPLHRALADARGLALWMPYLTDAMRAEFLGTSWDQVNRPRQKQAILDAFPERFARIKVAPHVNLQLGDSGIAAHFEKLLSSDWNARGARSVRAIYADVVAGKLAA